ncbi:uncharacterized protein LOC112904753 [Agrilus planipennis]|uniref:Uncharacterized protein LOC112904753 n=1 Tax=Agrilus planipennis TaxID=224129 RepID=A0A7F5R624_AGRPL|nr:uncharacterized protein LOC112904753 [Agrilus planipennis]
MCENWENLIVDEIKSELVLLSEQKGITKPAISCTPGSAIGDNYLGEIVNVIIEGDDGKENGKNRLNIIVKCAPRAGAFRTKLPMHQLYLREMYAYDTIFREFLKIQNDCNVKDVFNPFAVCYKTIPTDGYETLIMKNMKSIGYYMENRFKPLDYDHVLLTIRSYGKLHALSFALREHEPEKFRKLANNLKEEFFSIVDLPENYYDQITKPASDLLEGPLKEKFDDYRSRLQSILEEELCEETPGRYAVIGHGDCWTNNFLFKREAS